MTAAPIHSHNCTLPVVGAGEVVPPASLCHKESLRAALTGAISSAWLVLPSCPRIRVGQLLFQLLSSTARALTRLQCRHRQRDSEREAEWLVGLVAEKGSVLGSLSLLPVPHSSSHSSRTRTSARETLTAQPLCSCCCFQSFPSPRCVRIPRRWWPQRCWRWHWPPNVSQQLQARMRVRHWDSRGRFALTVKSCSESQPISVSFDGPRTGATASRRCNSNDDDEWQRIYLCLLPAFVCAAPQS